MMDFDFNRGASKIEKEHQSRRDELRKRKERDDKLKKEKYQRDVALAALKTLEEEKRQAAFLEKEKTELQEMALTGGIKFQKIFQTGQILITEHEDANDDKIILSEDCLEDLSSQDAFRLGPMTFILTNLSSPQPVYTHCGVREFSGLSGCIGLSKKIIRCLAGTDDVSKLSVLSLKFVCLPKCTHVKLRPKKNIFFEVGPVKLCLEENLRKHSTLSLGDALTVWYRGKSYDLEVADMKPQPTAEDLWRGCSLVDADVEVDLDASEETTTQMQSSQPSQLRTIAPPSSHDASPAPTPGLVSAPALPLLSVQSALGVASVGPEPSATESSVLLKLRLPSGATIIRRFMKADALRQLLLFIAEAIPLAAADQLSKLQLSVRSSFPPTNIRMAQTGDETEIFLSKSLTEIGIRADQESIFVSLVN